MAEEEKQQEQQEQQPTAPSGGGGGEKSTLNMDPNVAALLCYLGWWVTGLIFYLIEKENSYVRFHAMQSLITFGGLSAIMFVAGFIPILGLIIDLVAWVLAIVLWILLMIKAYQGERYKVPVIGDMAEKYV